MTQIKPVTKGPVSLRLLVNITIDACRSGSVDGIAGAYGLDGSETDSR